MGVKAHTVGVGDVWRAIAPQNLGGQFASGGSWDQAGPTVFARTVGTLGVVYKAMHDSLEVEDGVALANNPLIALDGVAGGSFEIRQTKEAAPEEKGRWQARVGTTTLDSNLDSGDANYSLEGLSGMEGLEVQMVSWDPDAYANNWWMHNGRIQGGGPASLSMANTGTNFRLHDESGGGQEGTFPVVGLFLHLGAWSIEQMRHYMMLISKTKDLPVLDPTGYGVVPDHVWSVKRAMAAGAAAPATWTSDGATGGEVLSRNDLNQKVIEFGGEFSAVR